MTLKGGYLQNNLNCGWDASKLDNNTEPVVRLEGYTEGLYAYESDKCLRVFPYEAYSHSSYTKGLLKGFND